MARHCLYTEINKSHRSWSKRVPCALGNLATGGDSPGVFPTEGWGLGRSEERMQVVLAVQQRDLGLALQLYLDAEPGLFVAGTATEAASLRALLRTASPDLVILDRNLPGYAPIHLLAG